MLELAAEIAILPVSYGPLVNEVTNFQDPYKIDFLNIIVVWMWSSVLWWEVKNDSENSFALLFRAEEFI